MAAAGTLWHTRPRTVFFDTKQELLDHLKAHEPKQPLTQRLPRFLYRGQTRRHIDRYYPPTRIRSCPIRRYSLVLEDLAPSDYRLLEASLATGTSPARLEARYGNTIAYVRTALTLDAVEQVVNQLASRRTTNWLAGLRTTPGRLTEVLSLGQHYGLPTNYLDLTSNWRVALWFASSDFQTGKPFSGGTYGVVYRIDRRALRRSIKSLIQTHGISTRDFRLVSIRNTPPAIGRRARAQHGWSLVGSESLALLDDLIARNGVWAYTFPHPSAHPRDIARLTPSILTRNEPIQIEIDRYRTVNHWRNRRAQLNQIGGRLRNAGLQPSQPVNFADAKWCRYAFGRP